MDPDNIAFLDGELDSIDNLPEPVRPFYKKHDDGKFRPNIRAVNGWAFEPVGGLKSTLGKLKESDRQLRAKLEAFSDIDPEAAREALAKLEEVRNWTPDDKVRDKLAGLEKQLSEKHAKETTKLKERESALYKALDDRMRRAEARSAIAKAKGNVDLLEPIVMASTSMIEDGGAFAVRVIGEGGEPRISMLQGNQGPMSIEEFVDLLKTDKRFMQAFEGTAATGSGSSNAHGSGRNGIPEGISPEQRLRLARQRG